MLVKRSNPLLGTAGKSNFPPGDDQYKKAVHWQTSSKHPLLPQYVTIGFEVLQESKPSDACESPRSVLDVNVHAERHLCGKSFRSQVQAVSLRNKGSQGVGLAIIADIQAEEEGYKCLLSSRSVHRQKDCLDELCASLSSSESLRSQHYHHRSQPVTIATNGRAQNRVIKRDLIANELYLTLDGDISSLGNENDDGGDDDDDDDDGPSSLGSMESLGSGCISSRQSYAMPNVIACKVESDRGCASRPSLFTVASVPSDHGSYDIRPISFLVVCVFCGQDFVPGKDIFMYRGDQAFCSMECRGEKIKIDEYNQKLITTCIGSNVRQCKLSENR